MKRVALAAILLVGCGDDSAGAAAEPAELVEVAGGTNENENENENGEPGTGTETETETGTETETRVETAPLEAPAAAPVRVRVVGVSAVDSQTDTSAIARGVRMRLRAIRTCYERAVGAAHLTGAVVLRVTVDEGGRTAGAEVREDTLGDGNVNTCLIALARRWRFPADNAGVFDATLEFDPGTSAPL